MDEPSTVNFDPDSFLSTLQSMLGESNVAKQPSPDPEDSLSDDDLSISSEEGVASDEEGVASNEEGGASEEGRPSIAELMADMDLEIANTELGKSFEKAKVCMYMHIIMCTLSELYYQNRLLILTHHLNASL